MSCDTTCYTCIQVPKLTQSISNTSGMSLDGDLLAQVEEEMGAGTKDLDVTVDAPEKVVKTMESYVVFNVRTKVIAARWISSLESCPLSPKVYFEAVSVKEAKITLVVFSQLPVLDYFVGFVDYKKRL